MIRWYRIVSALVAAGLGVVLLGQQQSELPLVGAGAPATSGFAVKIHVATSGTLAATTTSPRDTTGVALAYVCVVSTGSAGTFTNSAGDTYTTGASNSVSGILAQTYYKFNPTASAAYTWTFAGAGTGAVIFAIGFSGTFTGALDGTAKLGSAGTSTSVAPSTSFTPGTTAEVVPVCGAAAASATGFSITSPFSPLTDSVNGAGGVHAAGADSWLQPPNLSALTTTLSWSGSANAVIVLGPGYK